MSDTQKFYSNRLLKPFTLLGNFADKCFAAIGYESYRILFEKALPFAHKADNDSNNRWSNHASPLVYNNLSSKDNPEYALVRLNFAAKYWQTSDQDFNTSDYVDHKLLGESMDALIHHNFWAEMGSIRRGRSDNADLIGFFELAGLKRDLETLCDDLLIYQTQKQPAHNTLTPANKVSPFSIEARYIDGDLHGQRLWLLLVIWSKDEKTKAYIMKSTKLEKISPHVNSDKTSEKWILIKKIETAKPNMQMQVNIKCKSYNVAKVFNGSKIRIDSEIFKALFADHATDTFARREWPAEIQNLGTIINPDKLSKEILALEEYDLKNLLNDDDDEAATPLSKGFV